MGLFNSILNKIESSLLGAIDGGISDALSGFGIGGTGIDSEETIVPGDVDIIGIRIIDENGQKKADIRNIVKTIDIYEDILTPSVFCVLGIQDGLNVAEAFGVNGQEYVGIDFRTPGNIDTTSYLFRAHSRTDTVINENNKTKTYNVTLANPDVIKDVFVENTFNTTAAEAVRTILNDTLNTKMKINIEATKGTEPIVCTKMEPFKAIHMIATQFAYSKEHTSHTYHFFQNKKGYHFVTLEKLFHDASKGLSNPTNDRVFYFDNGSSNFDLGNMAMRNIIGLEYVKSNDSLDYIRSGGGLSIVKGLDTITGTRPTYTYDGTTNQSNFYVGAEGGKGGIQFSKNFQANHSKATTSILSVPINSARFSEMGANYDPALLLEKLGNQKGFLAKVSQNNVIIETYGDTDITVGQGIKCYIPNADGLTEGDNTSTLSSGNYLITALRHMIVNSNRPQHIMSMALVRGTIGGI